MRIACSRHQKSVPEKPKTAFYVSLNVLWITLQIEANANKKKEGKKKISCSYVFIYLLTYKGKLFYIFTRLKRHVPLEPCGARGIKRTWNEVLLEKALTLHPIVAGCSIALNVHCGPKAFIYLFIFNNCSVLND